MIADLPTEPAYEIDSPFRPKISRKAQDGSQGCTQGSTRGQGSTQGSTQAPPKAAPKAAPKAEVQPKREEHSEVRPKPVEAPCMRMLERQSAYDRLTAGASVLV